MHHDLEMEAMQSNFAQLRNMWPTGGGGGAFGPARSGISNGFWYLI
jgi:hypothetical protein